MVGGKFPCVNVHAEVYVFLIIYSVCNQTSTKPTVAVGDITSYQFEVILEHL